jgi:ABC-type multidrug transport system ATPase subunit
MQTKSLSQRSFHLNDDLKIRKLKKTYGTCFKKKVIKDISFDLSAQSAFGLVGPNGSGKTTTFGILAGELAKTSGYLFLNGQLNFGVFGVSNSLYWQQNIGVCFQNDFLYNDLTVEQHISFYSKLNGLKYRWVGDYFKKYGDKFTQKDLLESSDSFEMEKMLEKQDNLHGSKILENMSGSDFPDESESMVENLIHTIPRTHNPYLTTVEDALDILRFRSVKAKDLSSGNKRKLCILISLLKNLNLAIWDEATCGLDVLARHSIRQLLFSLKTQNQAKLLITTHFLNDVDLYCDQIGILKDGEFGFNGTTEALKNEFGGYCVVLRGKNKHMTKVLNEMKGVTKWRILEQKELDDSSEEPEDQGIQEEDISEYRRNLDLSESQRESGVRNRNQSKNNKSFISKRPSLHVNFSKKKLQSVIKLHVEDYSSISSLFGFLCDKVENKELYDFFLNQYNVEHIYVELMNDSK